MAGPGVPVPMYKTAVIFADAEPENPRLIVRRNP